MGNNEIDYSKPDDEVTLEEWKARAKKAEGGLYKIWTNSEGHFGECENCEHDGNDLDEYLADQSGIKMSELPTPEDVTKYHEDQRPNDIPSRQIWVGHRGGASKSFRCYVVGYNRKLACDAARKWLREQKCELMYFDLVTPHTPEKHRTNHFPDINEATEGDAAIRRMLLEAPEGETTIVLGLAPEPEPVPTQDLLFSSAPANPGDDCTERDCAICGGPH